MDCESKRQRQITGGDSPHVPLHSLCQQQERSVSLCCLESLTQQGNSTWLYYDGSAHKCRGSLSNRRTCFVIFVSLSLNLLHTHLQWNSLEICWEGCVWVCVWVSVWWGYRNGNRLFSTYFQLYFLLLFVFSTHTTNSLVSSLKLCKINSLSMQADIWLFQCQRHFDRKKVFQYLTLWNSYMHSANWNELKSSFYSGGFSVLMWRQRALKMSFYVFQMTSSL